MPRVLSMKYGSRDISLTLNKEIAWLNHKEPPITSSPEKFRDLLATQLSLPQKGLSNIGIVVADKTRLCQYPTYLPVLTAYLIESGIQASEITFYIAYGTHAPQTDNT